MLERIGNYKIVSELGRGGMGVVLKAYDETLKRHVAIKVLSEELTRDATFTARFIREAQSAAQLSHPNITQIYYIGEDNGRHFFVMEFVEGQSLHQMVRAEGKLNPRRAAGYILQAAHGLAAAHDLGVIHRDIKPANLMVAKSGLVKIADFGLAVMPSDMARLTSTGMLMGTPGYISPEQCMGEEADGRTDIYSLGVSFYELLAGTIPFQADSPLALVRAVVDVMPKDVRLHNAEVDTHCNAILQRMMAKTRPARWQNCHELVVALEEYLGSPGLITGAARATEVPRGAAVAAAMASAPAGFDHGPATEVAPVKTQPAAASTARQATADDGPATELLTPSQPVPATLRDRGTTALAPKGGQQLAVARPQERTLTIPAEVATAEGEPKRSYVPLIAAVLLLALALGGYAMWRNQPESGANTAQAAMAVPPAAPPEPNAPAAPLATNESPTHANAVDTGTTSGDLATLSTVAGGRQDESGANATSNAATSNAATSNAATSNAATSNAATSNAATSNAATSNAATSNAATSNAATSDSASASRLAASGSTLQAEAPNPVAQQQATNQPGGADRGRTLPGSAPVAAPHTSAPADTLARETAPASIPAVPKVAILVRGERALGGALEEHLRGALGGSDFDLVDLDNDADLSDMMYANRGDFTIGEVAGRLSAAGIGVVVLVRVEPEGERTLTYLGRQETAFSARAKINAFLVGSRRGLGPGWGGTIEYTKPTADKKAESFIDDKGGEVAAAIRSGWAQYRGK